MVNQRSERSHHHTKGVIHYGKENIFHHPKRDSYLFQKWDPLRLKQPKDKVHA